MSNNQFNVTACCGYTIMAMQRAKMADADITKTMMQMMELFGAVSEQEAVECFITTTL